MEVQDQREYLELVRQFMLSLAPVMARHRLAMLRHSVRNLDEDLNRLTREAAIANGRQVLEWAMHLASHYTECYNEAISAKTSEQEATVSKPAVPQGTKKVSAGKTDLRNLQEEAGDSDPPQGRPDRRTAQPD